MDQKDRKNARILGYFLFDQNIEDELLIKLIYSKEYEEVNEGQLKLLRAFIHQGQATHQIQQKVLYHLENEYGRYEIQELNINQNKHIQILLIGQKVERGNIIQIVQIIQSIVMKNQNNLKDANLKDQINEQLTVWNEKLQRPFIFDDVNDIYKPNPWDMSSEAIIYQRNQRLSEMNKILLLASIISLLIAAAIYIMIIID